MKPNDTEPPAGRLPFQLALANEKCWPALVRTESQLLEIVEPPGRSKATVQLVTVPGPSFVIVYRPS
jgi:hypothetical protein